MRKTTRAKLDTATSAALQLLQAKVKAATNPKATATRLWRSKNAKVFSSVRHTLESMSAGRSRCMYCEDSFGTDIEHFYPKGTYPRRAFVWTNYLLACSHCNSNLKRDQFPIQNRRPMLLNPTKDEPQDHLAFLPSTGEFGAIGIKGQPSIDVFALNEQTAPRKLPQARKAAFLKLQLLLEEYDRCLTNGNVDGAQLAKETVQHEPFPGVLTWLIAIARNPATQTLLRADIPGLVVKHSVHGWCLR